MSFDLRAYNRSAWYHEVESNNEWTRPFSSEVIAAAKKGEWSIVLTPVKPVPRNWFPDDLPSKKVLCLASGGGQQAPILAAAGAQVTLLDNSPGQLAQDRMVAERDNLQIELIEGDMRDLSMLADGAFDLIVHPCSNCFIPELAPVWNECHRVLKVGGTLMVGMLQPAVFLFDYAKYEKGELVVRHTLPYSDLSSLSEQERQVFIDKNEPLCFSHTLESQLGGQIQAGLAITGLFEDSYPEDSKDALSKFMPTFIATLATKF